MLHKLKKVIFLTSILLAGPGVGQSYALSGDDHRPARSSYYHQGEELWLNDTVTFYRFAGNDWELSQRKIVLSRDGLGQELESITEIYSPEAQCWKAASKQLNSYYYFYDTSMMSESVTQVWDKINGKWQVIHQENYDKKGKLIQWYDLDFDTANGIIREGTRKEHQYSANGHLNQELVYDWSSSDGNWTKSKRLRYHQSLDEKEWTCWEDRWSGQQNNWVLFQETSEIKNPFGEMAQTQKIRYNADGRTILHSENNKFTYHPDGNTSSVHRVIQEGNVQKHELERIYYDARGNMVKKVLLSRENEEDSWYAIKEWKYTTNLGKNLKYEVLYSMDELSGERVPLSRLTESVDVNGRTLSILEQTMQNGKWYNAGLTEMEYEGDMIVSRISSNWNEVTGNWEYLTGVELSYNQNNELIAEHHYKYNVPSARWMFDVSYDWEYDGHGNILSYSIQTYSNDAVEKGEKLVYEWHMFALSTIENREDCTIEVFPNPTKGVLHIKSVTGAISRVAILDQHSHLIEAISMDQQSTTVDISYLPSGNYFIECTNGLRSNTFKVVKL